MSQISFRLLPPSAPPFRSLFITGLLVLSGWVTVACQERTSPNNANLSEISIKELGTVGYDRFEIEMISKENPDHSIATYKFERGGSQKIDMKAFPGIYRIRLDYFLKDKLVFGADLCPDENKNNTQTFVPGPNPISLNICRTDSTPIAPTSSQTFSIKNGKLYDHLGKEFVIRGVNVPAAYYYDKTLAALPRVKELGFNTIRIVWCADNYIQEGRCERKDIRPAADLEKMLKEAKRLGLVAMVELQNATGVSDKGALITLSQYLLKKEVRDVLIRYQDIVIINLANEWYGMWDKNRAYVEGNKAALSYLRKGAKANSSTEGLPHVIVIDARGYAQDASSVLEHTSELMKHDEEAFQSDKLMISSHMYDVFNTESSVTDLFGAVRKNKWPFVVGEFACSHGSRGAVACDAIMKQADDASSFKINTIAWSLFGNGSDLSDLDILDLNNPACLTKFGKKLVSTQFGASRAKSAANCP